MLRLQVVLTGKGRLVLRRNGANDGVAMRVLYVFSCGPHLRPIGPGPLQNAPPEESSVPGRDRALPPGAAVQRRSYWRDADGPSG